jgi:hypothetical protein
MNCKCLNCKKSVQEINGDWRILCREVTWTQHGAQMRGNKNTYIISGGNSLENGHLPGRLYREDVTWIQLAQSFRYWLC